VSTHRELAQREGCAEYRENRKARVQNDVGDPTIAILHDAFLFPFGLPKRKLKP